MNNEAKNRSHVILHETPEQVIEDMVQALTWLSDEAVASGMGDVGGLIDRATQKAKAYALASPPTITRH